MTEQLTDGSRPPRKVLVVDDSCVCRAWLIAMCKRLYDGVELAQANDGDEAVEAFERELRTGAPYDLVLMDLNMVGDDDERPQLTGMLDERNGPQASARIRRAEYAAAHDSGTLTHANVIVITGSTRTDRWDLAYYHGCGIDGILCKPVSKAALSAAVTATQRRSAERVSERAHFPGESPLFGLSPADEVDMYIEPQLLKRAGQGVGPLSVLDHLSTHIMLDGLSSLSPPLRDRVSKPRGALSELHPARAEQQHEREDSPLGWPDTDSAIPDSPIPVCRSDEMPNLGLHRVQGNAAPRMPRRTAALLRSNAAALVSAPVANDWAGRHTPYRPSGPLHFLLVNAEPLMLMLQTALIQAISLKHVVTRAESVEEAIAKFSAKPPKSHADVILIGPVTVEGCATVDAAATAKAVRTLRRYQTERVLLHKERQHPSATFAVTASTALIKSAEACAVAAQEWGVDAVLTQPLRKNDLLRAASHTLRAKAQELLPILPASSSWDDSVLRKRVSTSVSN